MCFKHPVHVYTQAWLSLFEMGGNKPGGGLKSCRGEQGQEVQCLAAANRGSAVQTQDQTLLLEGTNSYRRAIQYQQLDKLQRSSNGAQGFHVQVLDSASDASTSMEVVGQTCAFHVCPFPRPVMHCMHCIHPSFYLPRQR